MLPDLRDHKAAHRLFESGQMTLAEYAACMTCLRREERPAQLRRLKELQPSTVRAHLRKGLKHWEIAHIEGVPLHGLHVYIYRRGLDVLSTDRLAVWELAYELGVSEFDIYNGIRLGYFPAGRNGRRRVFNKTQAQAVRDYYANKRKAA